jgi:hypothetical protein
VLVSLVLALGRCGVLPCLFGGVFICRVLRRTCERLRAGAQRKNCPEGDGDRGAWGVEEIHGDLVCGQATPAPGSLHGRAT